VQTDGAVLSSDDLDRTVVIMPAHDEACVIRDVVTRVLELGVHVVVVDDGSRDDTAAKLRGLRVNVLRHLVNLGQGAALQTGIDFATGRGARYLVTFDSDGQHDPADIPRLLQTLIRDRLDIVLGSRFLGDAPGLRAPRRWLLKMAILFTRLTTGLPLTDAHNGLRAFRVEVAPVLRITQNRMAHASELLQSIARRRLAFAEVPVTLRYSEYSRAKGQGSLGAVDVLYELATGRFRR
jgi:polyprenyl-phospho-N-acetylgalactosaminyl synthase